MLKETKSASSSMNEIADYYELMGKGRGKIFAQYYYKQIDILCSLPNLGKLGRVEGTRELVLLEFPYIIVYRVHEKYVQILSIMHKYCTYPDLQSV